MPIFFRADCVALPNAGLKYDDGWCRARERHLPPSYFIPGGRGHNRPHPYDVPHMSMGAARHKDYG
ncbi:hypothetical protein [Arthrobacter sp. PAMC 25486]|uniref:hypothetical protein n=1 Tax=Arthrobacter sp. PAMC 25486 TaxID=1494608 RepID=UPI0012FE8C2A|nr:hypothetical protein [Arthrobacter sp. PAMC 25486]